MKIDNKSIRIFDLSKKIGISEQTIISILREAGFYVPNEVTFFLLTRKHLAVIVSWYIGAVKHLFNETKKNRKNIDQKELDSLRNFFAQFVNETHYGDYILSFPNYLTIDEILSSKLDSVLIRDFFYRVAYSKPYTRTLGKFAYIASRISRIIKIRFRKINNDLRAKLSPILISSHYHIFTAEEDHISLANSFFSFSNMYNYLREAAINLKFNFKQQLLCQNINYF
ncbi:MAG: hypothetical protein C0512_06375 [Flavobacterium sp.]|nr:hypothetical protein [Flavobacterium sp.]